MRIRLSCVLNIKLKTKSVYKIIHDEKTVELNNSRYLPCNPYATCAILQDPIGSVLQDPIGSGVVRVTTGTSCTHGVLYQPQGVQSQFLQSLHVRLVKGVRIAFRNPWKLLHDNIHSVEKPLSPFGIDDAERLRVHTKNAFGSSLS